MNAIQPIDIIRRLIRRKRFWFNGNPTIALEGNENSFGTLSFDFKDEVLSYKIYIKDRDHILNCANEAIVNAQKLIRDSGMFDQ